MPRRYIQVAVLACVSFPLFASSAERPSVERPSSEQPSSELLRVKPGLWEITSVTRTTGMLPLPKEFMDTLTPQQRAALAAEAKADAASSEDTDRECITEQDLEQPFHSADMEQCRQSIVATTRTTQEARIICDGEHQGSGVFRISAPTPETMSGTLDLTIGEGADAFTLKGQLTGRWLGADCGDEAEDDDDGADQFDIDADIDDHDGPADDQEEEE